MRAMRRQAWLCSIYGTTARILFIAAAVCSFICTKSHAQDLNFSVSPSPVGSGARAAGMADAFVAVADDATAASWNPAGLVQLERPEISIVGQYNRIWEKFESGMHPETDSTHRSDELALNFLSVAYPLPTLPGGRNATISLNYQRKYDFTRKFDTRFQTSFLLPSGSTADQLQEIRFDQTGGLSAITPAFAIELTHKLSIGVAVNLWGSSFLADSGWEQDLRIHSTTTVPGNPSVESDIIQQEDYDSFRGENVVVGVLWSVTPRWNIGLRYDSGFTADTNYHVESNFGDSQEDREVRFPSTLAIGAAFRANDRFTLSMDISRTDWDNFYVRKQNGDKFSLVDGSTDLADPTQAGEMTDFDPTITVRLGAEYVFIPKIKSEALPALWSLRGGLVYDQEPASGRQDPSTGSSNGTPDSFYGATAGVGVLVGQHVNFDFAYQVRYGPDVNRDYIRGISGFKEDFVQHRLLFSMVVYF